MSFTRLGLDLLQESLKRAPADFAQVPFVVGHHLLAIADAVDLDARPAEIVIGFPKTAVADVGCPGSHDRIKTLADPIGKWKPRLSR
jgi:hypothetical protein